MKKIIISAVLLLIPIIGAGNAKADFTDTLRIATISTYPGAKIALPVYFFNDEALTGVEFVLKHDDAYLTLDSISLNDGRLDYLISPATYIFRDSADLIRLMAYDGSGWIPAGNGLLCNLCFSVNQAAAGQTINIDSSSWEPAGYVHFIDSTAENSIIPHFVKGTISVSETAPSIDSIWVDTVSTSAGQVVAVNINGFNEESLTYLQLALDYSSDNLIYDTTVFTGTRGATALNRTVSLNPQDHQILISLEYTIASSLSAGSGPLATIFFAVAPDAPEGIVTIDSTSYMNIQSMEFTSSAGSVFTPRFRSGFVRIMASTDVEDDANPKLPKNFMLAQNFPNPFNPATIIKFELPRISDVRLDVYNILGQKVKSLINRQMPAGIYSVTFDGRGDNNRQLASGVYLYRLKAGDFVQSRMMMLLK